MSQLKVPGVPGRHRAARAARDGFTILELLIVLSLAAVLLGIVTPRLVNSSGSIALASGRSRVSSSVSLARSTATRYGRVTYLVLDVAMDRIRIDVDTSFAGNQPPVSVHRVDLWSDMALDLRATEPLLCFDPRGISVATGACPGTGAVVYLQRGEETDSLVVSSTGRVSS